MGLSVEEIHELSRIFKRFQKPKDKDPKAIDRMTGRFAELFPEDKPSDELVREDRRKMLDP